jgi:serine/threonine-protein kinase
VAYYLLSGGKTYSVPMVNNEPVATARAQIAAAHLRSEVVGRSSSTVRKGWVISSNPPEGNNVAANTLVTLYVSTGPGNIAVPGVVGKQETDAISTLSNAGFKPVVKKDPTSTLPAGQVISQNPAPPATAPPNSTVTITVSGASKVPSVVGLSASSAQALLKTDGFNPVVQTTAGPAGTAPGSVWQQNPGPQTIAPAGTTVTIFVQPAASPSPSVSPSTSGSPTAPPTDTGSPGTGGGGGGGNGGGGGGNGGGGGGGL